MAKFSAGVYEGLSLYVRHTAWLAAVPEAPKVATLSRTAAPPPRLTRLQQLQKERGESYQPPMPPLDDGAYLIGYLWEVGPTLPNGMGSSPLTHGELAAWQGNTGIALKPWEARWLRRLSSEFLAELHQAEAADRPAPYVDVETEGTPSAVQRAHVARSLHDSIEGLMKL